MNKAKLIEEKLDVGEALTPEECNFMLNWINEHVEELKREIAEAVMRAHRYGRPEFAERLEKWAREHDLLPHGEKAN